MFRLDQEKDFCSFYFWLTLQYDDDHVPTLVAQQPYKDRDEFGFEVERLSEPRSEMCFSKDHCRGFFEKLRKRYGKGSAFESEKIEFKHFLVSEYGPNATHRPHYHCLLMIKMNGDYRSLAIRRKEMRSFIIEKAWPYGFVFEKAYHGGVLSYLTKYCCKPELLGQYHTMKPFTLISKGIGLDFLKMIPKKKIDQMKESLDFTYRYNGTKIELPRYYTQKILPSSLEDLRNLMPSDPQGDWSAYDALQAIRERKAKKQEIRGRQYAEKRTWKESFQEKQDRIAYEMAKFRSKVEKRKNI